MRSRVRESGIELTDLLERDYPFVVTVDEDDGGYVIEFPDLPGCMTQAESLDELGAMAAEAKALWLETALESGWDIPLPSFPETYSGRFNVRLPKSLHRRLVESAALDGVSLNQQVVSMLSEAIVRRSFEPRVSATDTQATNATPDDARAAFLASPRSIFKDTD